MRELESKVEERILELWKELNPSSAFTSGLNDCAGKLFVQTDENVKLALRKIAELQSQTRDKMQRKVLRCFKTGLLFEEPYIILENALFAFYAHLVKEGINLEHLISLISYVRKALEVTESRLSQKRWSIEIKIVTCYAGNSLLGMLKTIQKETQNTHLRRKAAELGKTVRCYMQAFSVKGVKNGEFDEVFPILEKRKSNIGRKKMYARLLKDLYDYPETANEIEAKASHWLRKELPQLFEITRQLAKTYHIESSVERVAEEMVRIRDVGKSKALQFIRDMREKLQKVIEKHLIRITPGYDTRIVETPHYLVSLYPSAAASCFDILTENPFNLFFVTTDPKRSSTDAPNLIQAIIHEEYGHCVNTSNSSKRFAAKPKRLQLLELPLGLPISEAIAFYREVEFILLLERLAKKREKKLTEDEKDLLDALRTLGDLDTIILENKFIVMEWRIIRFLRAIGDVRINLDLQSAKEFINWAHEQTGLSKRLLYDQIFTFQDTPGYAPCYCIAGEELRKLQLLAMENGKSVVDFNTYVSSIGFLPRTIYERKLRDYAIGKS